MKTCNLFSAITILILQIYIILDNNDCCKKAIQFYEENGQSNYLLGKQHRAGTEMLVIQPLQQCRKMYDWQTWLKTYKGNHVHADKILCFTFR